MKNFKKYIALTISLLAGGLLPFAFAPFYWFPIAVLSTAILFYLWLKAKPIEAALQGLLFGIGMFGVGVSWVFISIHRFGGASILLALFITTLFILVLAMLPAIQGYLLTRLIPKNRLNKLLLFFPITWVFIECLRSWLFTGFPWLLLGYSQTNSWLCDYAPIFSVYGVSFFVALSAALLVALIVHKKNIRDVCLLGLLSIWFIGGLLGHIQWTKPFGKPIQVSLIQGNIPQEMKWQPQQALPIIHKYQQLTEKHWDSHLIIWPEAAITLPFNEAQAYINLFLLLAKQHQTTIITGIPLPIENQFYNAAIALGVGDGMYFKRHLVPFGEYLPFKWLRGLIDLFNIPMSDFKPGPPKQDLITVNHIKIATYICYEIAYANLVKRDLPQAALLVTLTDDSWFGQSIASEQHAQIAQMRSLETGRYMLLASNNGVSAIIAPNGKIIKTIPRFKTGVLTGQVYAMKGQTPWVFM